MPVTPSLRSRAGSETLRFAQGKLREGSGSTGAEILRFAQDDSPHLSPVRFREAFSPNVYQVIEILDRMSITYFGSFDAERLSLAVYAFAGGAFGVDGAIKRTLTIEQHAHQPAVLPIGVFDTALAPGKFGMRTGLSGVCGKEQGAAKAVGVRKLVGGVHA